MRNILSVYKGRANLANYACLTGLPETACILIVREELSVIFHRDLYISKLIMSIYNLIKQSYISIPFLLSLT